MTTLTTTDIFNVAPRNNIIQLHSTNISPRRDETFAFHVFTPALLHRLNEDADPPLDLPVMALRSSKQNYNTMLLFDRIEVQGPSQLEPLFDNPLPGTGGRGVAIMFTKSILHCSFRGNPPQAIDCDDKRTPKEIFADVISLYNEPLFTKPKHNLNRIPESEKQRQELRNSVPNTLWRSANGKVTKISEMTMSHLSNTVHYLRRANNAGNLDKFERHNNNQYIQIMMDEINRRRGAAPRKLTKEEVKANRKRNSC